VEQALTQTSWTQLHCQLRCIGCGRGLQISVSEPAPRTILSSPLVVASALKVLDGEEPDPFTPSQGL